MLPQQWESVAQERMRDFQKEAHQQSLLAQLPQTPSRWRRWAGSSLVWVGSWLMRWGERMAQHECRKSVSVAS